ncbi:MAG: hypothetical protein MO853_11160 [Candidatus Protistobacter heckmanni]|nr:hypothetical protein [Candidatus Protistobacter heckmanni]
METVHRKRLQLVNALRGEGASEKLLQTDEYYSQLNSGGEPSPSPNSDSWQLPRTPSLNRQPSSPPSRIFPMLRSPELVVLDGQALPVHRITGLLGQDLGMAGPRPSYMSSNTFGRLVEDGVGLAVDLRNSDDELSHPFLPNRQGEISQHGHYSYTLNNVESVSDVLQIRQYTMKNMENGTSSDFKVIRRKIGDSLALTPSQLVGRPGGSDPVRKGLHRQQREAQALYLLFLGNGPHDDGV